jgi:hypothetical protein
MTFIILEKNRLISVYISVSDNGEVGYIRSLLILERSSQALLICHLIFSDYADQADFSISQRNLLVNISSGFIFADYFKQFGFLFQNVVHK